MKHIVDEGAHVALGLAVAAVVTFAAAWAYPVGAFVIHRVGASAMVVVVLINVGLLRRAWAKDRAAHG